jgi:hypothetical protein
VLLVFHLFWPLNRDLLAEILINAMKIFKQCDFVQIFGSTELSPMATYMPQRYIGKSFIDVCSFLSILCTTFSLFKILH